jgi:sugar phosphate isomerase/epimerase
MAKLFFSTSTVLRPGKKLQTCLNNLADLGIFNVEISSGHSYQADFGRILTAAKKKFNLLLHNFSPPTADGFLVNLAAPEKKLREKSIAFIKQRIRLTKKLGADYYSFHGGFSGYAFDLKTKKQIQPFEQKLARKYFLSGLTELAKYAEKNRIKIGFENNIVRKGEEKLLITCASSEIDEIFRTVKSPYLFLHLDAGHLNVTAKTFNFDKTKFLKKFREKIYAIHLNKNNGLSDQGLNFDKKLWLLPYLKIMPNLKYLIVETNGPLHKKSLADFQKICRN